MKKIKLSEAFKIGIPSIKESDDINNRCVIYRTFNDKIFVAFGANKLIKLIKVRVTRGTLVTAYNAYNQENQIVKINATLGDLFAKLEVSHNLADPIAEAAHNDRFKLLLKKFFKLEAKNVMINIKAKLPLYLKHIEIEDEMKDMKDAVI